MPAQCASCLQPIVQGQRFAFSGTEVFHRECAAQGTTESVGNRQRRQLASLEQRQQQVKSTIERQKAALEEKDRVIAQRNQRIHQLTDDIELAQTAKVLLTEQVTELGQQVQQLTRERDKAREDLALAQLPPPAPKGPPDHRDDTEIRFSLLEIDK